MPAILFTAKAKNGVFAPFLICLLFLVAPLCANDDPPSYDIGEIPSTRVYYGESGAEVDFYIAAAGLSGDIEYSMTIGTPPEGEVSIDRVSGRFSYIPSMNDNVSFSILFEARSGEEIESQQVSIYPSKRFAPEATIFSSEPVGEIASTDDPDYIDVIDEARSVGVDFNAIANVKPRDIIISGHTVVFEDGHENGLWSLNNNKDIGSLTILAETVIIRGQLLLPQTDVVVKALTLSFEDVEGEVSSIDTTPVSYTSQPAELIDGKEGHKGGSLELYVLNLEAAGDSTRFILNGGNGERAGQGKVGTNGKSRTPVTRITNGLLEYKISSSDGIIWIFWDGTLNTYEPQKSKTAWPTDGGPATPGGQPGNGGDGGDVSSTVDIGHLVSSSGGEAGTRAETKSGGTGGSPRTSWRVTYKKVNGSYVYSPKESHYSSNGASAAGPSADKPLGDIGKQSLIEGSVEWLQVPAMEKVLMHLQEAYLNRHYDYVSETLPFYLELFEMARDMEAYEGLDFEDRSALNNLYNEFISMAHRVNSGLDYFGNPSGWVPMLSFEVNKLAFENEIDRALKIMYVSYWLGEKAQDLADQQEALGELKAELVESVEEAKLEYADTMDSIPGLEFEARQVQLRIDQTIIDIQNIEAELLPKAEDIVLLKKTARGVGAIAQIFPVGQPYVGAAGSVISELPNIDPDKSWDENLVTVGTNAAGSFAETQPNLKLSKLLESNEEVDPSNTEIAKAAYADFQLVQDPVLDMLKGSYEAMTSTQSPSPEVDAELQRLLADEPAFKELQEELEDLNFDKQEFANKLAYTMQRAINLSLQIARGTLTIDAINKQILANSQIIDPRTQSMLETMGQDARHRLIKYHYFLAKAYEYRLLRPYETELDLTKVQDKFEELAKGPDGDDLSATDYAALSAPYEEQVSKIAFEILDEYNSNPSELSLPFEFSVPQSVIDKMNEGEEALFNLYEYGLFPFAHEGIRISDLSVSDIEMEYPDGSDNIVFTEVLIKHSGISYLRSENELYKFNHYNDDTRSKIQWGTVVSPNQSVDPAPIEPSEAAESMLKALLTTDGNAPPSEDVLLYSRPAANADLLFSTRVNSLNASSVPDVKIKSMTLRLQYDFFERRSSVKTLKIIGGESGISPDVKIEKADLSGKLDGFGDFQRNFTVGTSVAISVPERIGEYVFDGWEGSGISDPTAASTSVLMSADTSISPLYKLGGIESFSTLLVNVSSRAHVGLDENVLISGFVIDGTGSKKILARASGPALLGQGVTGVLEDPVLYVVKGEEIIATNNNWSDVDNIEELIGVSKDVGAFDFEDGSLDAATLVDLESGAYTIVVLGAGEGTGVSLAEVYDADSEPRTSNLVNISSRAEVGLGVDVLIPGFVVTGEEPKKYLIRGVGPGLEDQNVQGFLSDPILQLVHDNEIIATNDDWSSELNEAELAEVAESVGAFSLASGSKDSALLIELDPGVYTAVVSGVSNATGVGLVEVYELSE